MGHEHHHDGAGYYTEQLCTIGICGAMGLVAVLLSSRPDVLGLILHPTFHPYVRWGGIVLLIAVAIRAISIWKTAGSAAATHSHGHEHEHDCCGGHDACESHDHDHEHDHHHHEHHHAHEHEHDHAHEHEHVHAHAHNHEGHDHSWNPWRYAVLLLPIVLYFLNLPNKGFSDSLMERFVNKADITGTGATNFSSEVGIQVEKDAETGIAKVQKVHENKPRSEEKTPAFKVGIQTGDFITSIANSVDADGKPLAKPDIVATKDLTVATIIDKLHGKGGTKVKLTLQRPGVEKSLEVEVERDDYVIPLEFKELDRAALDARTRDFYTGRKGRIKGQFQPSSHDTQFSLMRMKMTCCAADVVPLQVIIQAPESVSSYKAQEWVEVEGQIRFDQTASKFIPVLQVQSMDKIQRTAAESDAYLR